MLAKGGVHESRCFVYDEARKLFAVSSCPENAKDVAAVLIGGMTDGPFSLSYAEKLVTHFSNRGVRVIQPVLRSSFRQYGISSLAEDVEDLVSLLKFSCGVFARKFVLIGHSTGCQDIVRLEERLLGEAMPFQIVGAVLQGPVSDRQYMESIYPDASLQFWINYASNLNPSQLMPSDAYSGVPITAYRFNSLAMRGGDDDLFYIVPGAEGTPAESLFPKAVYISERDECVPASLKLADVERMARHTIPRVSRLVVLEGADHGLSSPEASDAFVASVLDWLVAENILA